MEQQNEPKIYKGWIKRESYGHLALFEDNDNFYWENMEPITRLIQADFETGDLVSIKYWIFDKEVDREKATEALIAKTFGGNMDVDYELDAYSEYTILEFEEDLKIGGHDLIEELGGYSKKYAIIEVQKAV